MPTSQYVVGYPTLISGRRLLSYHYYISRFWLQFTTFGNISKGYGTNLADLGTPVHTLKELMGHSNIQTTLKFYIKNHYCPVIS